MQAGFPVVNVDEWPLAWGARLQCSQTYSPAPRPGLRPESPLASGGAGTHWGPALGAGRFTGGPEVPHDMNGRNLRVGDRVTVACVVTAIQPGPDYCNLSLETEQPMHPGLSKTALSLNSRQVTLDQHEDG